MAIQQLASSDKLTFSKICSFLTIEEMRSSLSPACKVFNQVVAGIQARMEDQEWLLSKPAMDERTYNYYMGSKTYTRPPALEKMLIEFQKIDHPSEIFFLLAGTGIAIHQQFPDYCQHICQRTEGIKKKILLIDRELTKGKAVFCSQWEKTLEDHGCVRYKKDDIEVLVMPHFTPDQPYQNGIKKDIQAAIENRLSHQGLVILANYTGMWWCAATDLHEYYNNITLNEHPQRHNLIYFHSGTFQRGVPYIRTVESAYREAVLKTLPLTASYTSKQKERIAKIMSTTTFQERTPLTQLTVACDAEGVLQLSFNRPMMTTIQVNRVLQAGQALYIRGESLGWDSDKAQRMVEVTPGIWKADCVKPIGQFKILLNNEEWETGSNHMAKASSINEVTPHFQSLQD